MPNVPCIHQQLPPEAQILVRLHVALRSAIFEVQGRRKSECTEWPQNELEHLTVNSTLYAPPTYP